MPSAFCIDQIVPGFVVYYLNRNSILKLGKSNNRETGPELVLKCFLLKMLRILKGQKWVARMSDALVSKRSELIKAFHLGLLKIEK